MPDLSDTKQEAGTVSNPSSTDLLGHYVRQAIDNLDGKLIISNKSHGVQADLEWGPANNRRSTLGIGANIDEALNDLESMAFGCIA